MGRLSADKLIVNEQEHAFLVSEYENILSRLQKKFNYDKKNEYKNLVNFSQNKTVPIHRFYDYKHGYAAELIKDIILSENPSPSKYIFDPFCGVGTTNLVAKELGLNSIGFDINPMAIVASKVKCRFYSDELLNEIDKSIKDFKTSYFWQFKETPKVVLSSFHPEQLLKLQIIKGYIDQLSNNFVRDFLHLSYLSIIEDASIRVKDGNGIKLKKNKRQIENLYDYFIHRSTQMLADIKDFQTVNPTEHLFFNESFISKELHHDLLEKKFSLSIFSPPYANCFDYCEVYKLEFWLGGFVESYGDFAKYRNMALRSHVNSSFDHTISNINADVDIIASLISTYNIWNKNIPDMLRGYFDDMYKLLKFQRQHLSPKGKCFIVVANSGYKGIMVPTDLLLAQMAEELGYIVKNIFYARKIRASGQQNADLHHNYDNLMRESIIELELE